MKFLVINGPNLNMMHFTEPGVTGQLDKFENTLNRITESIAVLIVTSCAIPVAVLIFFLWLVKLLT